MAIIPAKAIDRRLIDAASSLTATPQDLSDAVLGQLTPAQAQARVYAILEEIGVYDEVQERRLLLIKMSKWVDEMMKKKDDIKAWAQINKGLDMVSKQLEKSNINIADVSTHLAKEHARYLIDSLVLGFTAMLDAQKNEDEIVIDDDRVIELTQVGAAAATEYIETVTETVGA